ncbi:UNVERIFIED_CONTAM: hypothetical protein PYX00_003041 [Menopon gallinae]|uniref:Uncharacterized protein n=1 Tax=Menopon gallinae TaxID=328185 RepID=A0AAW2HYB6_9NEOP
MSQEGEADYALGEYLAEEKVAEESQPTTESELSPCTSDSTEECVEEAEPEEWIVPESLGEEEEAICYEEKVEESVEDDLEVGMDTRTSFDSEYLKLNLGVPLTYGLMDIAMKRPTDPIHYLAHYLIKWRWNSVNKKNYEEEVKMLTEQRDERIRREEEKQRQEMLRREQDEEERRRTERKESSTEMSTVGEEQELPGEDELDDFGEK